MCAGNSQIAKIQYEISTDKYLNKDIISSFIV